MSEVRNLELTVEGSHNNGVGITEPRLASKENRLSNVTFPLWDAPDFGLSSTRQVGAQWSERQLVAITLSRSLEHGSDDVPDMAVSTTNPDLPTSSHQDLGAKAMLEFSPRLMSAQGVSAREAASTLMRLSNSPGTSTSLTLRTGTIDAIRFEVPLTRDWVVVSAAKSYRICVAGKAGIAVPELDVADVTLWESELPHSLPR